jgi:hypothetical protein
MPQVTTMSTGKQMVRILFVLAFALLSWGCSSSSNEKAAKFENGAHPQNWQATHYVEYAKSPAQCVTCHGSTTDRSGAGGIAKVSCFSCHPDGPGHSPGWAAGLKHGRLGAMATPAAKAGFAYCFKCHGNNLNAGLTATSCLACHTTSPHPGRPWSNIDAGKSVHYATDPGNVPECFKCHANGANSTVKPVTPAPAGTPPGCFNNTLCHSKSI